MRSFARARSSSRRAPPIAASKPCSSIASSSVVVCSWLRDARGPVCSTTRPLSIDSWTLATTRRSPSSATRRSRYSTTSGKLWPVSTCMTGNGNFAGRNAFSARRSITIESLPPEKSSTGRSRSAATSRMMWIASDSRASRCESVLLITSQPARAARTGRRAGPAALAARAGKRRVRVADRLVALVVQRVVRQPALLDVGPAVVVAPVGERARLPELVLLVPAELRRRRARRRLVAADAGDPAVEIEQRRVERRDLGDREVEVGLRLPELVLDRRRPRTPRSSCRSAARPRARARRSPGRGSACRSRRRAPSGRSRTAGRAARSPPSGRSTRATALPGNVSTQKRRILLRLHRLDVRRELQRRRRQGAPPSTCRRGDRAAASRAG